MRDVVRFGEVKSSLIGNCMAELFSRQALYLCITVVTVFLPYD